MYNRHDRIRWAGRAALALFALASMTNVAHAADGRLYVYGAVVAPTCSLDASSFQQASQDPSHAVQASCATTQDDTRAGTTYHLKVTAMDSAQVDPRVQAYFQRFSPEAGTLVAVQTYR